MRAGAAWAYREYLHDNRLLQFESDARDQRLGLWGLLPNPIPPWQWRHNGGQPSAPGSTSSAHAAGQTLAPATTSSKVCDIKGNISHHGDQLIYHVPGQRHYDETQINTARGERWFCSEAEAQAAGWRRSKI